MRELNFFRPYLKKKGIGTAKGKIIIVSSLAGIAIGSMVLFVAFSFIRINAMNSEIDDMTKYMSNENNVKQFLKYKEAKRKVDALDDYYNLANEANVAIDQNARIDSLLISKLNSTLPQDTFLQSANISPNAIEFQGVSKSRTAVAEYQHNLDSLGVFDSVFISNINMEQAGEGQGNYIFSMKCSLKEGAAQ